MICNDTLSFTYWIFNLKCMQANYRWTRLLYMKCINIKTCKTWIWSPLIKSTYGCSFERCASVFHIDLLLFCMVSYLYRMFSHFEYNVWKNQIYSIRRIIFTQQTFKLRKEQPLKILYPTLGLCYRLKNCEKEKNV